MRRAQYLLMTATLLTGLGSLMASAADGPRRATAVQDESDVPPVKLDRLVVTGTRTERPIGDTPVRTELLLRNTIVRYGARNLADAIEYIPGAHVESNCQNCNTSEIRLLGLDGSYNQIALDGQPLLSSLAGVYGIEQIPTLTIDRIEVVKGGGSALYGASAVAGVVNVISRDVRQSGLLAEYRFESTHGSPAHFSSFVADHLPDGGRTAVSVSAQHVRVHPVDLDGDSYTELVRRRLESAGLRMRREFGAGRAAFDYTYTHEFRRGGNRLDVEPHLANIAESLDTVRHAASAAWEGGVPGGDFDYRLVLSLADTSRDSFYGGLGDIVTDAQAPDFDAAAYDEGLATARHQYGVTRNPLYVADAQFNRRIGGHTLTWGVQGEYETIDDRNVDNLGLATGVAPLTDRFVNYAAFVQDEWAVSERWILLAGARVDRSNQLNRAVVSPRAAFSYKPVSTLTWRGSVSTGFRAPRIFDEDLHVDTLGAEPIAIVNGPGLRRESALGINLGAVWNPAAYADKLAVEANAFATRLSDAFRLSEIRTTENGGLFQERFNSSGARVAGFEANVAYSPTPRLRVDVGAVIQRLRLDDAQVIYDDGDGRSIATRRFNKTPGRFAVLQVVYEVPERFDVALGARYLGPMSVLNNRVGAFVRTPSFVVFDLSFGRHFHWSGLEGELRLGVRNLTDDRQKDFDSGATRDSDYVYGPRGPRTFFAGLTCKF